MPRRLVGVHVDFSGLVLRGNLRQDRESARRREHRILDAVDGQDLLALVLVLAQFQGAPLLHCGWVDELAGCDPEVLCALDKVGTEDFGREGDDWDTDGDAWVWRGVSLRHKVENTELQLPPTSIQQPPYRVATHADADGHELDNGPLAVREEVRWQELDQQLLVLHAAVDGRHHVHEVVLVHVKREVGVTEPRALAVVALVQRRNEHVLGPLLAGCLLQPAKLAEEPTCHGLHVHGVVAASVREHDDRNWEGAACDLIETVDVDIEVDEGEGVFGGDGVVEDERGEVEGVLGSA